MSTILIVRAVAYTVVTVAILVMCFSKVFVSGVYALITSQIVLLAQRLDVQVVYQVIS